jgi:hypothetical protein
MTRHYCRFGLPLTPTETNIREDADEVSIVGFT